MLARSAGERSRMLAWGGRPLRTRARTACWRVRRPAPEGTKVAPPRASVTDIGALYGRQTYKTGRSHCVKSLTNWEIAKPFWLQKHPRCRSRHTSARPLPSSPASPARRLWSLFCWGLVSSLTARVLRVRHHPPASRDLPARLEHGLPAHLPSESSRDCCRQRRARGKK